MAVKAGATEPGVHSGEPVSPHPPWPQPTAAEAIGEYFACKRRGIPWPPATEDDAAPDLYDALERLVAATEAADNPGDMGVGSDDDAMIAARAALAKARRKRDA